MTPAMKRSYTTWVLLAGTASLCTPAFSADLTINFNGRFLVPTCNFSINDGNDTDMGTYLATYFDANTSTPAVQIPIVATGCTTGIHTIHLGFTGAADSSNNQLFAVNGASGVTGVAIELLYNAQSTRIRPGSTVNWISVDPSQPTNIWNLWARFYKTTGAIAAGRINVPVTVNFTYN